VRSADTTVDLRPFPRIGYVDGGDVSRVRVDERGFHRHVGGLAKQVSMRTRINMSATFSAAIATPLTLDPLVLRKTSLVAPVTLAEVDFGK
jgi:hypothetical protein